MTPIWDDDSGTTIRPWVTCAIVLVNVLVLVMGVPLRDWGAIPNQITSGHRLFTIFTSTFLHAGWVHLVSNMWFLLLFGNNVEDRFGHGRFAFFYFACALLSTVVQVAAAPESTIVTVGASGAISGVMAAYVVLLPDNNIRVMVSFVPFTVRAFKMIGFWFVFQIAGGLLAGPHALTHGGVAYYAHVGGFLAGLGLAYLVPTRPQTESERGMTASAGE
jgi:membrane associated rhomboid family serine protease